MVQFQNFQYIFHCDAKYQNCFKHVGIEIEGVGKLSTCQKSESHIIVEMCVKVVNVNNHS